MYWSKYFRMFADFVIGVKQAFTACDLRRIVLLPKSRTVYVHVPRKRTLIKDAYLDDSDDLAYTGEEGEAFRTFWSPAVSGGVQPLTRL